ncbi:MAG: SCO family protein [Gammaproteobacteria bacterium]|nr:SCO family protein [Gammaproteobacteria bacterium]
MGPRSIFIALVALFAIGLGGWLAYQLIVPPPAPRTATVLPAPSELPDFSLVDQHGESLGRDAFSGHWSLVFFGFTHCPDVCPLTLQVLASARQRLSDAGYAPLPHIVFVSVDPERDTPEVIGRYVDKFGDDTIGITGELEELRKLTSGLGIYFQKSIAGDASYSVDHTAAVLVINPRAQFHALFGAPHEAGTFVHDLPIIMTGL